MVHGVYGKSIWKGIIRHLDSYVKGIGYVVGKGDMVVFLGRQVV